MMRFRRAYAWDRAMAITALSALAAAGSLTVARAETATLAGSFGVTPQWSSVVECPCQTVRFSYMPTQAGIASGVREFTAQLNRQTAQQTIDRAAGYSLGSHVLVGYIRDNLDDERTRTLPMTLVGAPEAPHNPRKGNGHRNTEGLPAGDYGNVTFVVREYDPVADAATNPNFWSRINAKMSTHIHGYDDLGEPDVVWRDDETGSVTEFHRSDVLPMLKGWDWLLSDERMAELDAKYRPRIDQAYSRPWEDDEWQQPESQSTSASRHSASNADPSDEDSATAKPRTDAGSARQRSKDDAPTTATTDADADSSGSESQGGEE